MNSYFFKYHFYRIWISIFYLQVYSFVAEYLTELELPRTQTEFDDSLTLKIYLLQFINYYASIFYIAFFKGKFIGSPKMYNRIFNYRQEEVYFYHCPSFHPVIHMELDFSVVQVVAC